MDCFGDPAVIGKIGTDIVDGKCSWLVVKALALRDPRVEAIIREHYGRKDSPASEQLIKDLYKELDLPAAYAQAELDAERAFNASLDSFDGPLASALRFLAARIFRRQK